MPKGEGAASSQTENNPLEKIQGAIDSLQYLASRLVKLSEIVDRDHTLPQTPSQKVKLAGVVLHSRDGDKDSFFHPSARSARTTVLETAQVVEKELQELADLYTTSIAKQMEEATRICQETPCGGASWELLDTMESLTNNPTPTQGGNQKVDLDGMNTPCGRLQMASMKFLEITYITKPQIVMGSRAHLLLKLAMEFNVPLREIRESGTDEQNQNIRHTFETQVVPTPWLRSDEEYEQLLQIQQAMEKEE
jgi:hypothetical protein